MIRFRVPNYVNDVRFERHLDVNARSEVRSGGIVIQRITEQTGSGLPPNMECLIFQGLDQFKNSQHPCKVHRVRKPGRAVEHHLRDIVPYTHPLSVERGKIPGGHINHVGRVAHAPMVRFVQFHRDSPAAVPCHHLLVLLDGLLQGDWTAPVHLIEPK